MTSSAVRIPARAGIDRETSFLIMRPRREAASVEEKNYLSDSETTYTQAACLNRIFRKVNAEGLCKEVLDGLREDIDYVTARYGVNPEGAVLLAAVLEKSPTNNLVDEEDLAQYLGCTNIEFIRYHALLREMEKSGIVEVVCRGPRNCFCVTPETLKAVESDGPFTPVSSVGLGPEELFSRMHKWFEQYRTDNIDSDRLLEELDALVRKNDHLSFCRKVLDSPLGQSDFPETERRIFYLLSYRLVMFGNTGIAIDILLNFTGFMEESERLRRRIAAGKTCIQSCGLVDFANEDGFVDTDVLSLSDEVKTTFFTEVELAQEEKVRHRDVIPAESIQPRELFYNESEGAQVSRLEGLLDIDSFRKVQERLQEVGMRRGFNAVFYGAPGTGKTASVYELARRCGRDIFHVDMAKLRSKWVGESEKSVRGVFKMYRSMCRGGKAPILLFNEADAIFSKRIEDVEHSSDQMNNTLQNIILEEMETIDGILIATTNLLTNLDPAFERRFIFKVEFRLPEKESRAKIWRSMVPSLSEADARTLADRYSFSGGNIENVARKSTVEYVLSGSEPTLEALDGWCREEILRKEENRPKIGF